MFPTICTHAPKNRQNAQLLQILQLALTFISLGHKPATNAHGFRRIISCQTIHCAVSSPIVSDDFKRVPKPPKAAATTRTRTRTRTTTRTRQQQTTNSKQQTTNNKQQTTNNKQQTNNHKTTNNKQQTANNEQPGGERKPAKFAGTLRSFFHSN